MEIFEIEKDVIEEEESFNIPKTVVATSSHDWIGEDVLVIILKVNSFLGKSESYNLDICGKKMVEWVNLATSGCKHKLTFFNEEEEITEKIKPLLGEEKYTAVFFSDTPLLEKPTFVEAMEYARSKSVNVLKLPRGYIFNTEYIKNAEKIYGGVEESFKESDFLEVNNAKNYDIAVRTLRDKIVNFHIDNGVLIEDKNSVYIDADVVIEPGAFIGPNNKIVGLSYIGKEVKLHANNIIISSIVSNSCEITSSYLKECKTNEGAKIGPFERLV